MNLTIGHGERVGLIGPNGAGKTSLFHSICGVLKPTGGTVTAYGNEVQPGKFHPEIGLVFQNSDDQLFSPTVAEDIAFGPVNIGLDDEAVAERVEEAIRLTGTQHLTERAPHHLSGGEKRMVSIASVLAMRPGLVLYDEPDANLDMRSRRRLIQFLQNAPYTIMIASHNLEMVLEVCDRVILLDGGKIIADGPPHIIMGNVALMEAHGLEKPHSLVPHIHPDGSLHEALQIRVGKRIGSDAMVADGQHARIDGVISLAVLIAAFGAWVNLPIIDPIIGVLIGITIVGIAWQAVRKVFFRLMDAVDPAIMNRIEHFAETVEGVEEITKLRVHWVGHRLFAEVTAAVKDDLSLVESNAIASKIQESLHQSIAAMGEVAVSIQPHFVTQPVVEGAGELAVNQNLLNLLPARYQNQVPSAAPMGAAGLVYDNDGKAAWNEIWTDFCDLALAGGPPHRGTLLEPGDPKVIEADPDAYDNVLQKMERGIRMVTGLDVIRPEFPGWIGMVCHSEEMALWLLRAIVVENVSVRREDNILYFPAGADFRLEKEIKNVVTVVAKTNHYWDEHLKTRA